MSVELLWDCASSGCYWQQHIQLKPSVRQVLGSVHSWRWDEQQSSYLLKLSKTLLSNLKIEMKIYYVKEKSWQRPKKRGVWVIIELS